MLLDALIVSHLLTYGHINKIYIWELHGLKCVPSRELITRESTKISPFHGQSKLSASIKMDRQPQTIHLLQTHIDSWYYIRPTPGFIFTQPIQAHQNTEIFSGSAD